VRKIRKGQVLSKKQVISSGLKVRVGKYQLGWRWVEVFLSPKSENGSGQFCPTGSDVTELVIGLSDGPQVAVAILLHEAMEAVLWDLDCSYRLSSNWAVGSGLYSFHMTHAQYSEATDRVGFFLAKCLPEFQKLVKHLSPKK